MGHEWKIKDELISKVLQWTRKCWPTSKNLHQLSADTWCSLEDIPRAIDDRDGWSKSVWEIHAVRLDDDDDDDDTKWNQLKQKKISTVRNKYRKTLFIQSAAAADSGRTAYFWRGMWREFKETLKSQSPYGKND